MSIEQLKGFAVVGMTGEYGAVRLTEATKDVLSCDKLG